LLRTLRERPHSPPVVVITAHSSIEDAVDAMQRGAIDYLQKPFDEARLLLTVKRALAMTALLQENERLRDDVRARWDFSAIRGHSDALTAALKLAGKVATAEAPVLLVGESGTGKELFARAIHHNGKRSKGPFVAINCAAIPEGLLEAELFGAEVGAYTGAQKRRRGRVELARGGTLFLDEIGDMPLPLQGKLLRLLQERTFVPLGGEREQHADVRFVFATHRDLAREVKEGRFREDLRYRVSVLVVPLPPLRDRGDDVVLLADAVVERVCGEMGRRAMAFTPDARRALQSHTWPGNVRELGNVVERAVILAEHDHIDVVDLDLPTALPPAPTPTPSTTSSMTSPTTSSEAAFMLPEHGLSLEALERSLVEQALERTKGNKSQAARLLGLTRATLRYRIEKMGLGNDDDG
jgi:DNA-binding NtrC family response regulator